MQNPNFPSNNNPESSTNDQFDRIVEANYDESEIPTPETERASGLKTVEQALKSSTPDQLLAGLSKVASTADLQLLARLLNKAQDAEFFEQRDALLTGAEGSQFAQAMAEHLRQQTTDDEAGAHRPNGSSGRFIQECNIYRFVAHRTSIGWRNFPSIRKHD